MPVCRGNGRYRFFPFPAASAAVHAMVSDLKARGLNHTQVHENVYDNFLENRLRFIGHVLLHRMEIYYEYNTALIAISKKDLLRFEIKTGDSDGLVNYPLSIQGIKLAALVIDRDEERKWSFRSKGDFDVNTFARKYFEGVRAISMPPADAAAPPRSNSTGFPGSHERSALELQE